MRYICLHMLDNKHVVDMQIQFAINVQVPRSVGEAAMGKRPLQCRTFERVWEARCRLDSKCWYVCNVLSPFVHQWKMKIPGKGDNTKSPPSYLVNQIATQLPPTCVCTLC